MKRNKFLYNRGSNWSKMTTSKLQEILNHPHTQGADGKDYAPFLCELQNELWRRQAIEDEQNIKRWDIDFKKQLKALQGKKEKSA